MFLGQWGRIGQQKMLWAGLGRRTKRWTDRQHTGRHGNSEVNPWWCHQRTGWRELDQVPSPGDPSSDAEGTAAGTANLDFSSTVRKERAYPKNEARGEFKREEFMKQSRVPDRVESLGEVNRCQTGPVWRLFLLEAVPDWLRQSKNLVERRPTSDLRHKGTDIRSQGHKVART